MISPWLPFPELFLWRQSNLTYFKDCLYYGIVNEIADNLSRWAIRSQYRQTFKHQLPNHCLFSPLKMLWILIDVFKLCRFHISDVRAISRLKQAFADSTSTCYEAKCRTFVVFCCLLFFNIRNLAPLSILFKIPHL